LRSLGFSFKRQADRIDLYKKTGSHLRVEVRRRDWLDVDHVRSRLLRCGMPGDDVDGFFKQTDDGKSHP
jgi:hypothetical protein